MKLHRPILAVAATFALVLALVGCGKDETVHVGGPTEKGPIKRDIDTARNVAGQATDKVQQGEKDLSGGNP